MKDIWYGDNRDLIKWSVLFHLVRKYNAKKILQIAYYRKSDLKSFEIDGVNHSIPEEIINHFRRIKNIEPLKLEVPVHVFFHETFLIVLFALLCSTIAAFFSVKNLSRMKPSALLRCE